MKMILKKRLILGDFTMRTMFLACTLMAFSVSAMAEETRLSFSSIDGPKMSFAISTTGSKPVKSTTKDNKTIIETKEMTVYLWPVPNAKTVDEGVKLVDDVIKDEEKSMKIDETKTIEIGGAEAKHLIGHGKEADDGDPGTVDVVVFKVGGKVVVACVHGEEEAAPRQRQPMLDMLKSVKTQ